MEILKAIGIWLVLVAFCESILRGTFYKVPVIGVFTAILAIIAYIVTLVFVIIAGVRLQTGM